VRVQSLLELARRDLSVDLHEVGDAAMVSEVEHHAHVAGLDVEVHEADGVRAGVCSLQGSMDRERRRPHTPLGSGKHDHPAPEPELHGRDLDVGAHCARPDRCLL
jgi:hypothetical protein